MLCETHLEIGYQNRREDVKKSSLIADMKVEKLSPHTGAVEDVIARMSTVQTHSQDQVSQTKAHKEALEENVKLKERIKELEERQTVDAAALNEKDACCNDLQAKVICLQEKIENNESLLKAASEGNKQFKEQILQLQTNLSVAEKSLTEQKEFSVCLQMQNKQLEEQILQLQTNLSVTEQSLAEQKACNVSLQIQNMQLQRDFGQMQDWLWKILGKRDCLHEIILDLESELRATTTALLNQQKQAESEKGELLERLKQLEAPEKKSSGTAVKTEDKKELVEIQEKPQKFKPSIWGLWGKK